jgi:hypothetical protein
LLVLLYFTSLALIAALLWTRPHMVVRPSVWFCLGLAVRINGAAAFDAVPRLASHHHPELVRLLPIVFPFAVMAWLALTPGLTRRARRLYDDCRADLPLSQRFGIVELSLMQRLGLVSAVVLACYFVFVPLGSTGIVAVLTDPLRAAEAREESLKLIPFAPLRYGYLWHMKFLAPVLAGLAVFLPLGRGPAARLAKIALIALLVASVTLSGARSPAGMMMMTLAVVYLLRRGVRRGLPMLAGAAVATVVIAAVLSVLREGKGAYLSPALIGEYLTDGMFRRVFVTPWQTGVITNLYAQDYGLLGVANIRPLALLAGVEYVQLPNLVGLTYLVSRIQTVSANTSFLFDFQASFGLLGGWCAALGATAALDYLLLAFARLRGAVLVALLAAFMTAQHTLVSSSYFTCLGSHGILLIAAMAALIGMRYRRRLRVRPDP